MVVTCMSSGRGLSDELITRPEVSYQMWCAVLCDLDTSRMGRLWSALGRSATKNKKALVRVICVTVGILALFRAIIEKLMD